MKMSSIGYKKLEDRSYKIIQKFKEKKNKTLDEFKDEGGLKDG